MRRILFVVLVALIVAVGRGRAAEVRWVEGEVIVKFKAQATGAARAAAHHALGAVKIRELPSLRMEKVRLPKGLSVADAVRRYRAESAVEYAEPNFIVGIATTPNDPQFSQSWTMHNTGQTGGTPDADVDAPEAWSVTTGSAGVVVALIDTGIDTGHPDLAANLWTNTAEIPGNGVDDDANGYVDDVHGINVLTGSGNPFDDHGHGTHVAGILGAKGNDGVGIAGMCWTVGIMTCKFEGADGYGSVFDAAECLQYVKRMKDRGVPVVATNDSWGGDPYSQALHDAIDGQREILFVAAAGNFSRNTDFEPFYPSSYDLPNVIAVAATDHTDGLAWFSNFGRGNVRIAAPGQNVYSTIPAVNVWNMPGGYGYLDGTSMATPHVSGLAALLKTADPTRDWRAIRALLLTGGDPLASLNGQVSTGRRLNAKGSLTCANRKVVSILRPPAAIQVGVPATLQVESLDCQTASGPVAVTLSGGEPVTVHDDGVAPDQAAGDGVFSATWTPVRDPERITVSSPAGTTTLRIPELYVGAYLAEADTRLPYHQVPSVSGAKAPTMWSIASGTLPSGLTLNAATGEIAGTATTQGVSAFTLQLQDAWGGVTRDVVMRVRDGTVAERFARQLHEGTKADGRDVAVDASGNVVVLGTLNGTSTVAKYDASGSLVWMRRYPGGYLRDMAIDPAGAITLAGGTREWGFGDTLVIKVDAAGATVWQRTYDNGSYTDLATKVALDAAGNIYLAGIVDNAVNAMFAAKLSGAGNLVWLRSFSRGRDDRGSGIGVDATGGVYLGGSSADSAGRFDFVVRKYDAAGGLAWTTFQDSGSVNDFLVDLALDAAGSVYALGAPDEDGLDAFVTMKFNGAGGLAWARSYANVAQRAAALAVDAQGNVYAAGSGWAETSSNDWDFLTLKYDPAGNLVWKKSSDSGQFQSSSEGDFAYGLAVDASGATYVAGTTFDGVAHDMLLVKSSVAISGPGEASAALPMTAQRGAGSTVNVSYAPGCGATDHVIVWGSSVSPGGVSWSNMACGRGVSGATSFDPGALSPGAIVYFVVVAQNATSEGSYGHRSSGAQRPEATGTSACDLPQSLTACN